MATVKVLAELELIVNLDRKEVEVNEVFSVLHSDRPKDFDPEDYIAACQLLMPGARFFKTKEVKVQPAMLDYCEKAR